MVASNSSLVFEVRRGEAELVCPAEPTPKEVNSLSCEDNKELHRYQLSCILFYEAKTDMKGKDPAMVMKTALAKALVHYYPWAGRLREASDGCLVVECTAEGVGFVEADADVRLEEFGELESLHPPFTCVEELLYYKTSAPATIGFPIFAMQVTRMLCGGFILTFTFSHAMSDAKGICQFVSAITELARGVVTPSLQPIWQRELLNPRIPRATCPTVISKFNNFFQTSPLIKAELGADDVVDSRLKTSTLLTHRSFFFGSQELEALRSCIPDESLRGSCSSFDLIASSVFHSRTIALQARPEEEARLSFPVDARRHSALPDGYYGNACVAATFSCPAGDACGAGSLGFLVEQVKKAKEEITEEYARSFWALKGRLPRPTSLELAITDWTRAGFSNLDFGWGKPVYAGNVDNGGRPQNIGYVITFQNGRLVNLCLPVDAMDRFSAALKTLIHGKQPLVDLPN